MTLDPTERLIGRLESGGFEPREVGPGQFEARCPGHNGGRRNLSVRRAEDGGALLFCHHSPGCPPAAIVEPLGLTLADLFPRDPGRAVDRTPPRPKPARRAHRTPEDAVRGVAREFGEPTACWLYHDAEGFESFRVFRFDHENPKTGERLKSFRPVHVTADGWVTGDPPGLLPLYRLPELAGATRVFVTEGEKAAEVVRGLGLVATTSAHGARSAGKSAWSPLAGREVVVLPDHDDPGEHFAADVLGRLAGLNPRPTVRVVRLGDIWRTDAPIEKGNDVVEWRADGVPKDWEPDRCRAELERAADFAPVVDWTDVPTSGGAGRSHDGRDVTVEAVEPPAWPPLRIDELPPAPPFPAGVFPDVVARFIQEVAESIGCAPDFPAIQCLTAAAGAAGRSTALLLKPGYFARASIYAGFVGPVSDGKSPSLAAVHEPIAEIDQELEDEYRQQYESWQGAADSTGGRKGKPQSPPPQPRRVDVENFTFEKLFEVLAANPRGVISKHDELSSLLRGLDQYRAKGKGNDREHLLSAWSGVSFKFDRKTMGAAPLRVRHPCLSIVGGIQTQRLSLLGFDDGDGLVERFVFAYPDPRPVPHWSVRGIDPAAAADWAEVVGRLWNRHLDARGGGTSSTSRS